MLRRLLKSMVEVALFARDCLFFTPTALCIGLVGAAVFLSAKSMLAGGHAKDERLFANSGFKESPYRHQAWAVSGFPIGTPQLSRQQRMGECHSGSCLYTLQPTYVGR
jgi:hypothetical protein